MSQKYWQHPIHRAEDACVAQWPPSGGNISLTPGEHESRLRQAFRAGDKASRDFAAGKLPFDGTKKKN